MKPVSLLFRMLVKQAEGEDPMAILLKKSAEKIPGQPGTTTEGPQKRLANSYSFQSIPISVENCRGSYRAGTDPDGHKWKTHMGADYGYIRGTEGADGEHLDVYVRDPKSTSPRVYIVRQLRPDSGAYDEEKVLLGFDSTESAKKFYRSQYNRKGFFGGIREIPMDAFKALLKVQKGNRIKLTNDDRYLKSAQLRTMPQFGGPTGASGPRTGGARAPQMAPGPAPTSGPRTGGPITATGPRTGGAAAPQMAPRPAPTPGPRTAVAPAGVGSSGPRAMGPTPPPGIVGPRPAMSASGPRTVKRAVAQDRHMKAARAFMDQIHPPRQNYSFNLEGAPIVNAILKLSSDPTAMANLVDMTKFKKSTLPQPHPRKGLSLPDMKGPSPKGLMPTTQEVKPAGESISLT